MTKNVTLLGLARILNVSRTTVSNAFNRPDQLSPELRDQILNKAKELGYYGPNPAGRMLRTGKAGAIGVIFFQEARFAFIDQMAIKFMEGVASVCDEVNANLMILPCVNERMEVGDIFSAAVDGFIIHSNALPDEVINQIHLTSSHLVTVDRQLSGIPYVCVDNILGARLAAEHILEAGHEDIVVFSFPLPEMISNETDDHFLPHKFIDNSPYSVASQRLLGYREGFTKFGRDFNKVPIIVRRQGTADRREIYDDRFGYEEALKLLSGPARPSAILCMSDAIAIGVLKAADELGISVPKELSLIGFDDVQAAAETSPPLTTLRQDGFAKGETAARVLFQQQTESRMFEPELIIRHSTARN